MDWVTKAFLRWDTARDELVKALVRYWNGEEVTETDFFWLNFEVEEAFAVYLNRLEIDEILNRPFGLS